MKRIINAACMVVIGLALGTSGIGYDSLAFWIVLAAAAIPASMQELGA